MIHEQISVMMTYGVQYDTIVKGTFKFGVLMGSGEQKTADTVYRFQMLMSVWNF